MFLQCLEVLSYDTGSRIFQRAGEGERKVKKKKKKEMDRKKVDYNFFYRLEKGLTSWNCILT